MKFASLFLGSLLYIAVKQSPVNSLELLSVGDFDLARSAILSVAKDINAKRSRGLKVTKSTGVGLFGRSAKGWSFRRLSKYKSSKIETTTVSVTTKVTKTTKPRNFNKFNEVMDQVERAMAQAQLSRASFRLTDLKKDINSAVNQGNVRFARRALGLALYTVSKSSSKSRRGKRSAANVAKTFLAGIKKDLGDDKFSDFLALQGEVTLMYAVDITGSMRGEINASKAIVTEITKYDRSEPVDYILSSFGDPISE